MQPRAGSPQVQSYGYPFYRESLLRHAILSGQRDEAMKALDAVFTLLKNTCPTFHHLRSDAMHLLVAMIRKCYQTGIPIDPSRDAVLTYSVKVIYASSPAEVFAILQGLTEQLLKAVGERKPQDRTQAFQKAIQYIHAHYRNHISLEDLAEVVGLSYSYCSRLFTHETGISFQTYLTHVRLENAKRMLLATGLTVEEVAAQVGYEDPSHFIRVFKRVVGKTPRRFADLYALEQGAEGESDLPGGGPVPVPVLGDGR